MVTAAWLCVVLINNPTMPVLYHHGAANNQHVVGTGIEGNTSVGSVCSWRKYYPRRSLLPHEYLMMKPVTVFETLDFLTGLKAQKNIISFNTYVSRIRLPQNTRVLWRGLRYATLCNLTRADSHGHLSGKVNPLSFLVF
jgi:hypothetical protein